MTTTQRASIGDVIKNLIASKAGEEKYTPEARAAEDGAVFTLLGGALSDLNRLADAAEALAWPATYGTPKQAPTDAGSDRESAQLAISAFVVWLSTRPVTAKIGASYPVPLALDLVNEYMKVKDGAR